jgi:hypothetical protein
VQWWYGDAAKSLLMLPDELFGTIDLVLADLSETITSKLVTEGIDIMAAIGLLLQPYGVLVKNELYFEKMSSIFDYTVQVNVADVPVVCAQTVSMGSPGVDFLRHSPREEGVEPIRIRSLSAPQNLAEAPPLSAAQIKIVWDKTLGSLDLAHGSMGNVEINEFDDVGEGCLLIGIRQEGVALLSWDGKDHVDLNLFTYDESVELADCGLGYLPSS